MAPSKRRGLKRACLIVHDVRRLPCLSLADCPCSVSGGCYQRTAIGCKGRHGAEKTNGWRATILIEDNLGWPIADSGSG